MTGAGSAPPHCCVTGIILDPGSGEPTAEALEPQIRSRTPVRATARHQLAERRCLSADGDGVAPDGPVQHNLYCLWCGTEKTDGALAGMPLVQQ